MTTWDFVVSDLPGPEGFDARLITFMTPIAGQSGVETRYAWFMFLRPTGSQYWLCGGAVEDEAPTSIKLEPEKRRGVEKVCALLGLTWEEIEATPAESASWQLECIRKLEDAPQLKWSIRNGTPEQIAEWRAEVHTMEPGEDLRSRLTGIDFRAGRN